MTGLFFAVYNCAWVLCTVQVTLCAVNGGVLLCSVCASWIALLASALRLFPRLL